MANFLVLFKYLVDKYCKMIKIKKESTKYKISLTSLNS